MHLGMGEMLVVFVIAMLVFGPSKIPQLGDALGKGIRNFKQASRDDEPAERAGQAQLRAAAPAVQPAVVQQDEVAAQRHS
ncbi:MAG TPA: twin-arginine translocase TatA/TatE family subunit [Anaeromyxobacteraceae bacterium]|nr:twin-arginine translocase TatA/TatE family subunit [Anaeromyxobacteraceae bacterium]